MKKAIVLLLTLCLLLSLAACQNTAEPAKDDPAKDTAPSASHDTTPPAPQEVETVFWTDSQPLEPGLLAAAEAFTKEYPHYTIKVEAFPGSERPQKLALAKESGTLPSLFLTGFFTSADEIHQGAILPVTDIVKQYYSDIPASTMEQVAVAGNDYMVPIFTSPQGLLYNADIFKAAGLEQYISASPSDIATWTVDELDTVILPALKDYFAGTSNYPMTMYCANEQNDSFLHNLLKLYDGEIFRDGMCVAAEDPNTVKALEKIAQWVSSGYTNADATTRLWTDCNSDFRNQLCAISAGQFQSYLNHYAAFENGSAEAFDCRIATVPMKKADGTDSASMHTYTYGFVLMNVDEGQQQLARDFLAWLSENQSEYLSGMVNGIPTTSAVLEKLSGDNPLYASYQAVNDLIFDFTGGAPGWVATRSTFYPEIQSCISGQKSAQQALSDYTANANEIIQEYMDNSLVMK